jgi:hypothetical protein
MGADLGVNAGADAAKAPPASAAPAAASSTPAPAPKLSEVRVSPIDELRDRLAYREELRNEIIENQLDDRHDVTGNTLYRLKFDVSILPGSNTREHAQVKVTLSSRYKTTGAPEGDTFKQVTDWLRQQLAPEQLDQLHEYYQRWLEATERDLDGALQERRYLVWSLLDARDAKAIQLQPGTLNDLERFSEYLVEHYQGRQPTPASGSSVLPACKLEDATQADAVSRYANCVIYALVDVYRASREPTPRKDLFNALFADWFLSNSEGMSLKERYKEYATLEPTDEGDISVEPKWDSSSYFTDEKERRELKADLEELAKDYPEKLPRHFMSIQGLSDQHADPGLYPGVVEIRKSAGFARFVRFLLAQSNQLYTYCVTPKQAAQRLGGEAADKQTVNLLLSSAVKAGPAGINAAMNDLRERQQHANSIERQPLVVGFSEAQESPDAAGFGWTFGPRFHLGMKAEPDFRHQPTQQAVSVIVSAPAWWRVMSITVDKCWLDGEGECKATEGSDTGAAAPADLGRGVDISLPGEVTEIDRILFQDRGERRPVIFTNEMQPARLRVNEPADIVIPGRLLWRSTVVTLGSQRASSIAVLPNMTGIIAHFEAIRAPADFDASKEPHGDLPLTVWTSAGKDSVQKKVLLYAPAVAKPEGT